MRGYNSGYDECSGGGSNNDENNGDSSSNRASGITGDLWDICLDNFSQDTCNTIAEDGKCALIRLVTGAVSASVIGVPIPIGC
jgi:hypothetical protein